MRFPRRAAHNAISGARNVVMFGGRLSLPQWLLQQVYSEEPCARSQQSSDDGSHPEVLRPRINGLHYAAIVGKHQNEDQDGDGEYSGEYLREIQCFNGIDTKEIHHAADEERG